MEAFAIVLSILLAFAIEAGWDARKESAEETRALESLVSEFEANRSVVEQAIQRHDSILVAARLLAEISTGAAAPPEGAAEMNRIFGLALTRGQSTHYASGTLSALLASGDIELISNPEIRSRVAAWPSVLEEALEDEQTSLRAREQFYVPYVIENVPSFYLLGPSPSATALQSVFSEIAEVLGNDRLEGILGYRITLHMNAGSELQRVRVALSDLISLIREELEGSGSA